MTQAYRTTAAYVSGAICGHMWMPCVMAGKPIHVNLRGPWGIMPQDHEDPLAFSRALHAHLIAEGGDFQNAQFAADTVIRVERRSVQASGKYTVHVWEREVSSLPDCADLVNPDAYSGDFFGDCD